MCFRNIARHVLTGQIPPQQQPLCHGQLFVEVSFLSKLPVKAYGPETNFCYVRTLTFVIWPWLSQGHDTIARNIKIQNDRKRIWVLHGFLVMCVLWPWPLICDLGQGHDMPFGHQQQLCKIFSRSNLTVRSCSLDMDLRYVYYDLDLRDMTLGLYLPWTSSNQIKLDWGLS